MISSPAEAFITNSNIFSSFRPSPPESLNKASVSFKTMFLEANSVSVFIARCNKASRSAFVNAFNI
ncbi:hypothetical protein D3C85_436710 [compost metagenome]